jgi:hypothetical protein
MNIYVVMCWKKRRWSNNEDTVCPDAVRSA